VSLERKALSSPFLREEQLRFRLLWIAIFAILLLFASVAYPPNTLSLRSINQVLLAATVWNLIVFFTPLARKLRGAFDPIALLMDIVFITWIVRVTGGFQSDLGPLYFVELILVALFSERLSLLIGFMSSVVALCSSLLSFHAEGAIAAQSQSFLIRLNRWRPEDLPALGLRTVELMAVYLIGYVGRGLIQRAPKKEIDGPAADRSLPASAPASSVVESPRAESKPISSREELLSIISHELRSPLTILRAYTDLLRDPDRKNGTEEIVTKIDEEVTQLSEMVENLDAIVDERTASPPQMLKVFDLTPWFRSLVDKHQALTSHHEFVVRCAPDEIPVRGDQIKLTRAFNNLLGNALKYSPDGGRIEIDVDVLQRRALNFFPTLPKTADPSQPFVVVRIADRGMGMSAQALASAFEKFQRFDTERTGDIPGSGLGLYLTRKIIEQHQGAIHLESIEGRGTTVAVALPLYIKGDVRA
jgi:signal transduction histidine kinase